MKNKIFLICFLLIGLIGCMAGQKTMDIRLPFLKGDKYGVVDKKGKMILPYEFEKIKVLRDLNIILAFKNSFWGIYNSNGLLIMDHKISDPIGVLPIEKLKFSFQKENIEFPKLIKIIDHERKTSYFINPDYPQKNYPKLKDQYIDNNDILGDIDFCVSKIFRVKNKEGLVNFIDDKGVILFQNGFKEGFVISNELVAISNGDKYAIHKGNTQLSEFIYSKVYVNTMNGNFVAQLNGKNNEGKRFKEDHLYNSNGNLIDKSSNRIYLKKGLAIVNKDEGSIVYDEKGIKQHFFQNKNLEFQYFNGEYYFLNKKKNAYGLYGINAQPILDTIYSIINFNSDIYLSCRKNQQFIVFDTSFNKVLEVDSVFGLYPTYSDKLLKYTEEVGWKIKYGVMDIYGNKINEQLWEKVEISFCGDLAFFENDSISLLYNHHTKEIIYPRANEKGKFGYKIDCDKNEIRIHDKGKSYIMKFDGSNFRTYGESRKKEINTYKAIKIGGKYKLQDSDGNFGKYDSYEKIDIVYNKTNSKVAYVCQNDKNGVNSKVYNNDLKNIIPEGYFYSEKRVHSEDKSHRFIFVFNESDFKENKRYYRSGLIDFEGNWIIEPFYGIVKQVFSNLIIVIDYEKKEIIFYDSNGQKVSKKKYDLLAEDYTYDFTHNRIAIGVYEDKSYLKKVEKIYKTYSDYRSIKKEVKKLGEPIILYGFINKEGKEIIKPQFINTNNFWHKDMTKFVQKFDKKGKTITQKIDTSGHVILSLPYEEVIVLNEDHLRVKKNDKWAISDSLGNLVTEFKFDVIEAEKYVLDGIFIGRDSLQTYIISKDFKNTFEIEGRLADFHKINDEAFYVKQSYNYKEGNKSKHGYKHYLISRDMKLIEKFENLNNIQISFENIKLPEGYITIREKGQKPYVYHLASKTSLKE